MSAPKTRFVCSECGFVSARWLGRCPQCGNWGTLVEEGEEPKEVRRPKRSSPPVPISEIPSSAEEGRLSSGVPEFDRVLGGGIVPGSVVLIGGEPGIGKSTLLLQVAAHVARNEGKVFYLSGEESAPQIRRRAERLDAVAENLFLICDSDITALEEVCTDSPALIIVDSIQTVGHPDLPSPIGSVTQVREATSFLIRLAKTSGIPILIAGHVTKEGSLAGPKLLEHMVDVVLYFEGEHLHHLRLLRAFKNRFGPTNELGVFEMRESGLEGVPNPSALFLEEHEEPVSGTAVVPVLQGTRPILVEIQALCAPSHLAAPRRVVAGLDYNRTLLVLAVLERRAKLTLAGKDVYINVAGGMRIDEPAADLAVAVAIASSLKDKPVKPATAVFGEVGLGGEVRSVYGMEIRLKEAKRLGFQSCLLPASAKGLAKQVEGINLVTVKSVREAIDKALRG